MNKKELLLILTAALVFSACGGTGEQTGGGSTTASATSNVNANSAAPAAGSAANATTTNASAVVQTPATAGDTTPSGAATGGGARANTQQANMPKPQVGSGGNDFYLFTQARGALNADAELKTANIAVDVKEGVVTLKGGVASAVQKAKAEQLARAVGGVKDVKNQLRVSGGN